MPKHVHVLEKILPVNPNILKNDCMLSYSRTLYQVLIFLVKLLIPLDIFGPVPEFKVFKSPSCTLPSTTSRWTAKTLPVCAMPCEALVVDKASDLGSQKALGFGGKLRVWCHILNYTTCAFTKLSFRSCN